MNENSATSSLRYVLQLGNKFLYNDQFAGIVIDADQTFCVNKIHFVSQGVIENFKSQTVILAQLVNPLIESKEDGKEAKMIPTYSDDQIKEFYYSLKEKKPYKLPGVHRDDKGKEIDVYVDRTWYKLPAEEMAVLKKEEMTLEST